MTKQWTICEDEQLSKVKTESELALPILKNPPELNHFAEFFKALGDETRLQIIGLLMMQDMCLCEITSALDAASSTINHHLKLLERGQVISSRREGRFTVYHLNDSKMIKTLVNEVKKEGTEHV